MSDPASTPINSVAIYGVFWKIFTFMGIVYTSYRTRYHYYLRIIHDIAFNVIITIIYPVHLFLGLFAERTLAAIFKNLAIVVTVLSCSIKHYIIRWELDNIRQVEVLLKKLDKRAITTEERKYFNAVSQPGARNVMLMFVCLYTADWITSAVDVLYTDEVRLLYPAWLPFDWTATMVRYYGALFYQIFGILFAIIQNIANDYYAPAMLSLLCGHVRLLDMRLRRIGNGEDAEKTQAENNAELVACIKDHKILLEILRLVGHIFYYTQLVQFLTSGIIFCVTVVYELLYVDNFWEHAYYTLYFISMSNELLVVCYYGSKLQQELQRLPYAVFCSNWIEQSKDYHQNQRIFTALAMNGFTLTAGGIINIQINAFLGTCKMAYSLYTMMMQLN